MFEGLQICSCSLCMTKKDGLVVNGFCDSVTFMTFCANAAQPEMLVMKQSLGKTM